MPVTTSTTTTDSSISTAIPSLKDLASSESSLRRKNLGVVLDFLRNNNNSSSSSSSSPTPPPPQLDSTQCLQLWRGLSVALYMHDTKKMVSVQQLAATLAGTVNVMYAHDLAAMARSNHNDNDDNNDDNNDDDYYYYTSTWTSAFWETMAREWAGIDQWRINKYLLLVRLVVRAVLVLVFREEEGGEGKKRRKKEEDGDEGEDEKTSFLDAQIKVLEKWPLSARERKVPDGLRLHVLDVWVEEVDRARQEAVEEEGGEGEGEGEADGEKKEKKKEANNNKNEKEQEREREQEQSRKRKRTSVEEEDEIVARLMQPIRTLAKEALGKGVKVRAREIVRELDGQTEG